MIKELHLHNWKSFGDATLYIDPLTFVIGTNASGKSNILDALLFLHLTATGMPIDSILKEHIRGGSDWAIKRGCDEFSLAIVDEQKDIDYVYEIGGRLSQRNGMELCHEKLLRRKKGNFAERLLFYTDEVGEDISSTIVTRFYTGKKGKQKRLDLTKRASVLSQYEVLPIIKDVREVCVAIARDLNGIFVFNPIPNQMRNYCPLADSLLSNGGNIAGVLAGMQMDEEKELEDKLSSYVRPLPERDINRVWAEKVGCFGNDAMLYCEECWNDGQKDIIDARSMSDGTLRFIAIVMALLTGKPNSLLVIEEIDNGVHPSRAGELVKALCELGRERHIDVLCTTHNPVLIDSLGVDMLPFISYVSRSADDGASKVEPVEDVRNITKLMSSNTVGELMVKDKLSV